MAVDPELFLHIEGSTDSEVMFYLALTFGLNTTPRRRWPAWPAWWRRWAAPTGWSTPSR
ncbi:hypothetical protein SFUMM280S_03801 [Streptomyces fumanus]